MNVEQTLAEELRAVGAAVRPPPPPDAAVLVRQAQQERARRWLRTGASAVLAAAVVLGVVLLGNALGHPSAAPSPMPQPTALPTGRPTALPTGEPPQLPFVKNDVLYLDGQAQPGSWMAVTTHRATTIAYPDDVTGSPETGTIVFFHAGAEIARFRHVASSELSPDGSKAAWLERKGARWFMVSYDLETGTELGRVEVDAHELGHVGAENEGWESLSGVDDDGVVTWGGVVAIHTWTPGHAPVASNPPADPGAASGDFPVDDSEVSLSPDGAWGAWTEDRTGQQQGTDQAPPQWDMHLFVQKPGVPSSRFEFPLPPDLQIGGADWETTGSFLTQVFEDPTGTSWHYIRCTIATRSCEVAPMP